MRKQGVTVSTLAIAVAVMLIIATSVSVVGIRSINTANFDDYASKLKRVADATLEYIDSKKEIPTTGEIVTLDGLPQDLITELTNNNDMGSNLCVVDLNQLDVVSNIGNGTVQNSDVYVVSEDTNNIYYLKGKEYKGTTYYGLNAINSINLPKVNATSIAINGNDIVTLNDTEQLTITFTPSTTTNKEVYWSSSNSDTAIVTQNGKVYGKSEGKVTITAKYGEITSTHNIEVIFPKPGDLVAYTPTADPTKQYTGATYIMDEVEGSATKGTYIESTTQYTPGNLKWVYLGKDENGNILLTSQETTNFTVTIAGQDGYANGVSRIDELCNTLYGNSTYAKTTRNMKLEDVDRILGYDGDRGIYGNKTNEKVSTPEPLKAGKILEIENKVKPASGITLPRLLDIAYEDYYSDLYQYTGVDFIDATTAEYKLIFKRANGTTNMNSYWLSTPSTSITLLDCSIRFYIRDINGNSGGGTVGGGLLYGTFKNEWSVSRRLRPVIVLKSNYEFGQKNANGEFTLREI